MKKVKLFSFFSLFYNDRFVMIFALFVSVVTWFIVASLNTADRPREISNVPVTVTLSQGAQESGLRVFSQSVEEAKVSVRGDSVSVYSIDPSNLRVVAEGASTITQPTSVPLTLRAETTTQIMGDYSIEIEPATVFVDVDYYREVPFEISTEDIIYRANSAYLVSEPALSTDTVTVSGPEKEIDKIDRVTVEHEISGELVSTQNFTADIVLYDRAGNRISTDLLTLSREQVDVTITVLSRQYSTLEPTFSNQPEGVILDDIVSIEPESIQIAGPGDILSNFTSIRLESIDFSEISPLHNIFQSDITLPAGCRNVSMIHEAIIRLDLSGYATRRMELQTPQFEVRNLSANKTSDVYTQTMEVVLVGPPSVLENIEEEDVVIVIDMSGRESFTGHIEMPVSIEVTSSDTVWAYGDYQASVEIGENTE